MVGPIIIKRAEQLYEGMEVELKQTHWQYKISGRVSKVEYSIKGRNMGHKPIIKRAVKSVSILCENGEELSITHNDFKNIQIRRI